MSEEQLKAFLLKVQADNSLQEKLKAAGDANAVAAIAAEADCVISVAGISNYIDVAKSELSEQELEAVTGGATPATVPITAAISKAACAPVGFFLAGVIAGVTIAKC